MSLYDDVLNALEDDRQSLMYEYDDEEALKQLPEDITAECVEDVGGEGEGDTFYAVWKFTRGDDVCFIRFDGFYASSYGSEYEDCWEVAPKEVTVTRYEAVK